MITATQQDRLMAMVEADDTDRFYDWAAWKILSAQVKKLDNYECQRCKAKGRYRRGEIVHHVKHLKDRPDLALSITDPDTGARQLVTLCRRCHEEEHPERMRQFRVPKGKPVTEERWD